MDKRWSNRQLAALFIPILVAMFVLFAGVFMAYADVPPDLPLYNMSRDSLLAIDKDVWGQTLGHTIRSGKMVNEGDITYWYKTYELGTATPKHRTLPHNLSITIIVFSPYSSQTGVSITLRYARDMGGGLRGTTLLYMYDDDYDVSPDRIVRRTVCSKNLRIYAQGRGINNDTYVFNSTLSTDMPEWNEWVTWLVKQYQKEGAYTEGGVM